MNSWRRLRFPLAAAAGLLLAGPAQAQFYLEFAAGSESTSGLTMSSRSDDRSSVCDEFINPRALLVPGCTTPDRGAGDGWKARFGGGRGFSGRIEFGYRLDDRFRVALAYAERSVGFDQTVASTDASGVDFEKLSNELAIGQERIGEVTTREAFALVYFDWRNRTRWTPWVGAGLGVSRVGLDFSWLWARSPDPEDITTGRDQPNYEEIRRNLAGTVSAGSVELEDELFGQVLVAGIDYELTESVAIGFRAQATFFDEFEAGPFGGDLLRSHEGNLRLDGSEPVSTWSRTSDTDGLSVGLALRYEFGGDR